VFFYTTFGGEALSLAAAQATVHAIRDRRVPERLERLGQRIREGYNELAATHGLSAVTRCDGPACRTMVGFTPPDAGSALPLKSLAQQELLKRGVLWAGTHTLCNALTDEEVTHLLAAWDEVLAIVASALASDSVHSMLRGEPVEPVFRRTSNFDLRPRPAPPHPCSR
jgi:glutamate-1-semialdehyde aminotransferase